VGLDDDERRAGEPRTQAKQTQVPPPRPTHEEQHEHRDAHESGGAVILDPGQGDQGASGNDGGQETGAEVADALGRDGGIRARAAGRPSSLIPQRSARLATATPPAR